MLKIPVYVCLSALLLPSCTSAIKNNDTVPKDEMALPKAGLSSAAQSLGNESLTIRNEADMIGYWVGMFEPDTALEGIYTGERHAWDYSNKINIAIEDIKDGRVKGHSVVAGNNRPFEGKMVKTARGFDFTLTEPGDDPYDGVFNGAVITGDTVLRGIWKANKKIRISSRKYTLTKKMFRYNPDWQMAAAQYIDWSRKKKALTEGEGEFYYDDSYFTTTEDVYKYNASKDLLTKEQVANLKKADLFVIRNAIYARHGYSFRNQQLRVYFDQQPWYIPVSTDVKAMLTDIEKKNIELLLRYEKNAKEYYDVFGRG